MPDPYFDEFGAPVVPQTLSQDTATPEELSNELDKHLAANPPPDFGLSARLAKRPLPQDESKMGINGPEIQMEDLGAGPAPSSKPVDPYTGANAPKKRPGQLDITGWDKAEEDALGVQGQTERAAGQAKITAEQAASDRKTAALTEHTNNLASIDAQYQRNRAAGEAAADQETANWLREQQTLASKEPNRARYWESQTSFGKAMWLMSVGMTAFANMNHPGAPNAAAQMLMDEVNQDVGAQKDRLANERELGRTKGAMMKDKQARKVHDNEDDYSKAFQRLESVKSELLERANRPGSAERAAMDAGVQLHITQMQTDMIGKRNQQSHAMYLAKSAQDHAAGLQAANQKFLREQQDRLFQQQKEMENQKALDKIAEDQLKPRGGKISNADGFDLPIQSGIKVVTKGSLGSASVPGDVQAPSTNLSRGMMGAGLPMQQGKGTPGVAATPDSVRSLRVDKKQIDKAGEIAQGYHQLTSQVQRLRTAMADSSSWGRLVNTDGALRSALIEAGSSVAKVINGGGRLTDPDQMRGQQVLTGTDLDSVIAKIKGLSQSEMLNLLDDRLARIPKEAASEITTRFGSDLQDNETVSYEAPDLQNQPKRVESRNEISARLGATVEPSTEPQVPPTEQTDVQTALDAFKGATPSRIQDTIKGNVVIKLSKTSRDVVETAAKEALTAAQGQEEKVLMFLTDDFGGFGHPTRAQVKDKMLEEGLTRPEDADITEVLQHFEEYRKTHRANVGGIN